MSTIPVEVAGVGVTFVLHMPIECVTEARARAIIQQEKLDCEREKLSAKLANPDFLDKAPAEVINRLCERESGLWRQRQALNSMIWGSL